MTKTMLSMPAHGDLFEKSLQQGADTANKLVLVYREMKNMKQEVTSIRDQALKSNKETNQKIDSFGKRLEETDKLTRKAIDLSRVDHNQDRKIVQAASKTSARLAKKWISNHHQDVQYGGQDYLMKKIGQVRTAIYHELKNKFNVNVRSDLRMADFDYCLSWLNSLHLYDLDAWRIKDRQTTLITLNKWESRHHLKLTQPND